MLDSATTYAGHCGALLLFKTNQRQAVYMPILAHQLYRKRHARDEKKKPGLGAMDSWASVNIGSARLGFDEVAGTGARRGGTMPG